MQSQHSCMRTGAHGVGDRAGCEGRSVLDPNGRKESQCPGLAS